MKCYCKCAIIASYCAFPLSAHPQSFESVGTLDEYLGSEDNNLSENQEKDNNLSENQEKNDGTELLRFIKIRTSGMVVGEKLHHRKTLAGNRYSKADYKLDYTIHIDDTSITKTRKPVYAVIYARAIIKKSSDNSTIRFNYYLEKSFNLCDFYYVVLSKENNYSFSSSPVREVNVRSENWDALSIEPLIEPVFASFDKRKVSPRTPKYQFCFLEKGNRQLWYR